MKIISLTFFLILATLPCRSLSAGSRSKVKPSGRCQSLMAEPPDAKAYEPIIRILGYQKRVLNKIRTHRPELFNELASAAQSNNQETVEEWRAEELFRGMSIYPRDYNPLFDGNYFFARHGENWFARDSSIAWNYSRLEDHAPVSSYQDLVDLGERYFGLVVCLQVPRNFILTEKGYNNVSVQRNVLGNESVFITEMGITEVDPRSRSLEDTFLNYDKFISKFKMGKTLLR